MSNFSPSNFDSPYPEEPRSIASNLLNNYTNHNLSPANNNKPHDTDVLRSRSENQTTSNDNDTWNTTTTKNLFRF